MFTGLVAERGTVRTAERGEGGLRLEVTTPLAAELATGDSVAVNGVCLTAAWAEAGAFSAYVMAETVRRSSLGALSAGDEVNLELPLRAGDRLGGHVVQGHVDGVGEIESVEGEGPRVSCACAPPPSFCATSSRRARSPSTAHR
jgi:Riboflavin synthase alpha chain